MTYGEENITTVGQLKNLAKKNKAKIDTLTLAQEVLDARMDAQVTASTDADADFAAEVVDARVDIWANTHDSLGANVRDGQQRLTQGLRQVQESHQTQIDDLAEMMIEEAVNVAEAIKTRRLETSREEEFRIAKDAILQDQIDTLANAVLGLTITFAELRESARDS